MKDWLWISAVVLLALFVLGLCWLFFSKYCPCRRTRSPEPVLPTHVEPQIPTVTQREWIRPTSPWAPLVTPKAHPPVPRRYPIPPSAPHYYALSPTNSPNLHLKFADLPINEVVKTDRGITTLDLHHMTVREAIQTTNAFLQQSFGIHEKVRIVTGRGLHSEGGTPRLKPAIELLLEKGDFEFREVNNGGCFEVSLS